MTARQVEMKADTYIQLPTQSPDSFSADSAQGQPLLMNQYKAPKEKKEQEVRPFLGDEGSGPALVIDDDDCTMVLVFPRLKQDGGTVDPASMVESPKEKAARIFVTADNPLSEETMDRLAFMTDEPMRMDEYQTAIRNRFREILEMSGLQVTQFPSIDEDEDFVKVYLPEDGDVIKDMADKLNYAMPLKEATYRKVAEWRSYPGHKSMTNSNGEDVRAFRDYSRQKDELFQPFRFVDTVRILDFWLDEWVSLDEMEQQGVILAYFPCPKCSELEDMYREMATPSKMFCIPDHKPEKMIREYWGEEIAFFFRFMSFLCRSMTFLAVIGAVYYLAFNHFYPLVAEEYAGWVRSGLCVVVSIWVAFIFQVWQMRTARVKQEWGVSETEQNSQERPDWDYNFKPMCCGTLVNLCALLYMVAYIGAIASLLKWQRSLEEDGKISASMKSISALSLTVVIKGGSFAWGKIAPALANAENFRTEDEYNKKLSGLLATVKLFVALYPFWMQCFVSNYMDSKCAATLEEATAETWPGQTITADALKILAEPRWSYLSHNGHHCVYGCHPGDLGMLEHLWAPSNCEENVIPNLRTYFAFQVVIEIAFIVIGIVLTAYEMLREMRARKTDCSDSESEQARYSFLQWMAKLHKYEYDSWGGSIINDYLEVAISYSVVVCFGIITPVMAVFALVGLIISWRCRIYRMIFVTRRPTPRASAGLGVWYSIFSWVNTFAVLCNISLVSFFFYPGKHLQGVHQLTLFLVGEHLILLLRETVVILFPSNPTDVTEIEYYNNFVKHSVDEETVRPSFPPSDLKHLDLSLNGGEGSEEESSQNGIC